MAGFPPFSNPNKVYASPRLKLLSSPSANISGLDFKKNYLTASQY